MSRRSLIKLLFGMLFLDIAPYKGWVNPNYAFQKRQGVVERGLAQQVGVYVQVGEATLGVPAGTPNPVIGEGTFTVSFFNSFIVKPTFTYGSELGPNLSPVKGSFPTLSATVCQWNTQAAGHSTLYLGAVIAFVVGGVAGSQVICHYSFQGKAMSPLATNASNDTGSV
jgi:hypothetical protein